MIPATGVAPRVGRVKTRCACTAFSILHPPQYSCIQTGTEAQNENEFFMPAVLSMCP